MNERLRELRTMAGLSQFVLAKRTGIDRTRLSLAENGHIQLKPDETQMVKQILMKAIQARAVQFNCLLSEKVIAV